MGSLVMYGQSGCGFLYHEDTHRFTFELRYLHSTKRRAEGPTYRSRLSYERTPLSVCCSPSAEFQKGRTLNNEVGVHGCGACVKVDAAKRLMTQSSSLVRPAGELGPSQESIRSPVPACATSSSDIRRSLPTFFVSKVQRVRAEPLPRFVPGCGSHKRKVSSQGRIFPR